VVVHTDSTVTVASGESRPPGAEAKPTPPVAPWRAGRGSLTGHHPNGLPRGFGRGSKQSRAAGSGGVEDRLLDVDSDWNDSERRPRDS
jgi:hypothetical protein